MSQPTDAVVPERLRRRSQGRLLGGVAAGVAEHLGVDVLWVRLAFALLSGVNGFGLAVYLALWVFTPVERPGQEPAGLAAAARSRHRPRTPMARGDVGQLVALGAIGLGLVLLLARTRWGVPRAVGALARAQERDLRGWLYGAAEAGSATIGAALEKAAAEIEQAHGVPVEVVLVGDAPLAEDGAALVRAAREAMVNAARHSSAPVVDVYAECAADLVEVFVRDRGTGFDPNAVPADRMGLRGSVVGRVERHGGTAVVRSAPGEGTEVRLTMTLRRPSERAVP